MLLVPWSHQKWRYWKWLAPFYLNFVDWIFEILDSDSQYFITDSRLESDSRPLMFESFLLHFFNDVCPNKRTFRKSDLLDVLLNAVPFCTFSSSCLKSNFRWWDVKPRECISWRKDYFYLNIRRVLVCVAMRHHEFVIHILESYFLIKSKPSAIKNIHRVYS